MGRFGKGDGVFGEGKKGRRKRGGMAIADMIKC